MIDTSYLVNREFDWGEKDCFEIVRDLYRKEFGIEIKNYARPSDWKADSYNLILSAYQREGFMKIGNWQVSDLRPGDIMAMAIGEGNPNHLAVYIGNNEIVHHLYGNLSTVAPLARHWIYATCFLLRHPDVPDLRQELPSIPIEEILRGRHKVQTPPSA